MYCRISYYCKLWLRVIYLSRLTKDWIPFKIYKTTKNSRVRCELIVANRYTIKTVINYNIFDVQTTFLKIICAEILVIIWNVIFKKIFLSLSHFINKQCTNIRNICYGKKYTWNVPSILSFISYLKSVDDRLLYRLLILEVLKKLTWNMFLSEFLNNIRIHFNLFVA